MCQSSNSFIYVWQLFISAGSIGLTALLYTAFKFEVILLFTVGFLGILACLFSMITFCCNDSQCWVKFLKIWNLCFLVCLIVSTVLQMIMNVVVNTAVCDDSGSRNDVSIHFGTPL